MRFSKNASQYWSLFVVTVAVCMAVPFTQNRSDRYSRDLSPEPQEKAGSGGRLLPFFGFDGLPLAPSATTLKSWWDARQAVPKLRELNANTVIIRAVWNDSQKQFEKTVTELREAGIKVVVEVSDAHDWLEGKHFTVKKATRLLAQARNQGLDQLADMIIIEGDAISFANQTQRQRMYGLAKEYFPNTPIVRRYGPSIEWAEAMHGKPHPLGGTWETYRFGPGECDVSLISVGRGVSDERSGVQISGVIEQLNQLVALVKSRDSDVSVLVAAQFGESQKLDTSRDAMWSPRELDQFVSAVLTSAEVDGLLFRGLGNFRFDLAYPDFRAHRAAFRGAAPMAPGRGIAAER